MKNNKSKRLISLYLLLSCYLILICNVTFSQTNEFPVSYYNLNFSKDNMRLVKVEAKIVVQEPYLEMNPWGIPPEINRGYV